jgi:hypothetical protein
MKEGAGSSMEVKQMGQLYYNWKTAESISLDALI